MTTPRLHGVMRRAALGGLVLFLVWLASIAGLLVLHGDADQVIPISHGRALFAAANEPKTFVTYAGGRHNDLRLYGAGAEIVRFLTALPEGGTVKSQ